MPYDIHIKTVDGSVQYPNALSYGFKENVLWVQIGEDADKADTINYSPNYWQEYSVDPHSKDPFDLRD